MESITSTSNYEKMQNKTSNDKTTGNATSTSIHESGLWKQYETFPTQEVVIEQMTKIGYTPYDSQKNDSRVQ